jgi:NADPH-dependent curcumin reductase CurA
LTMGGWQKFAVLPEKQVHKIPKEVPNPELFLALSISGLTAYFGLENIGKIKEKDVVVISAAAGGVGQIAVQYAKAKGCIVCGIAGGE